jgi:ribosomal protein S18 acetylase RimI-like enzyme
MHITARELQADGGEEALSDLVRLLREAVEDGASVGFLHPLDASTARSYWMERLTEASRGHRVVLTAIHDARIIGSVQLAFPSQPNGRHRAEVQRLIVRRDYRKQGIGSMLMLHAETAARARGRWLLVLNTRADDAPERLYERLGYIRSGRIPDFARNPDGSLNTTTIMWRRLA